MDQYYFSLEIYEELINTDYVPFSEKNNQNIDSVNYLKDEIGSCKDLQLIKVKKQRNRKKVIKKVNISNAHPLAVEYFDQPDIEFESQLKDILSEEVLKGVDISNQKVDFTISKKMRNEQLIGICKNTSWNEIDSQRTKYCYYFR